MISLKDLIDKAIVDGDKRLCSTCVCGNVSYREIGDICYWCTGCHNLTWECDCEPLPIEVRVAQFFKAHTESQRCYMCFNCKKLFNHPPETKNCKVCKNPNPEILRFYSR